MRVAVIAVLLAATCWLGTAPNVRAQVPTLEVTLLLGSARVVQGEPIQFTVRLHNISGHLLTLPFPTTQRYDVVLSAESGDVSRWSAGRFFSAVFRQETWMPDESFVYTDSWLPAG